MSFYCSLHHERELLSIGIAKFASDKKWGLVGWKAMDFKKWGAGA